MDINKDLLIKKFEEGDLNYVFSQALIISDFVISDTFKIYDPDIKQDMQQECMENLWKKIIQGKVKKNKNLFAFIWKNSQFRILEILRKENNRRRIAQFSSYDEIDDNTDYIDMIGEVGDKYISTIVKELSTVK